jgi:hypothetical protein
LRGRTLSNLDAERSAETSLSAKREVSKMKRIITLMALVGAAAVAVLLPGTASSLDPIELKVVGHNLECHVNNNDTVTCTGTISGLGSQTADITVDVGFSCENEGGNFPGGQVSATQEDVTPDQGNVTVNVTTSSAKCPDKMTEHFGPNATITVEQTNRPPTVFVVPVDQ